MKFRARYVAFSLLAVAYAAASFLAFRRNLDEHRTDRVTIRLCQWQLESGVRDAIDAIIKRYEELNPRVHVVQIAVPDRAYLPWVQTQMVGGNGPDVVEYSWPWPDTARNFLPITDEVMKPNPYNKGTALEGVPWRDTFIDGMQSPDNYVQSLGQYYGVSMCTGQSRIVYNRELLKTITGHDEAPRNYREFMAMCEAIKAHAQQHNLNLSPLANSRTTHIMMTTESVAFMSWHVSERLDFKHKLKLEPEDIGRSLLREEWTYDEPEVQAGFSVLKEIGAVSTPGFQQRERDTALNDFFSRRAVMVVAPGYEASSLKALCPFPLGAFRFPYAREDDPVYGRFAKGPFGEGQVQTGMPFYLNRWSKHRAEALDFMKFLGSQEGSTIFTRVSDWLPVVNGVQPSDFASKFQIQAEGYNWFASPFGPSSHIDSQNLILSVLYTLWGTDGSVTAFTRALSARMPATVRDGFRHDVIEWRNNIRREDSAGAAAWALAPAGQKPELVRLIPQTIETNLYHSQAVIAGKP